MKQLCLLIIGMFVVSCHTTKTLSLEQIARQQEMTDKIENGHYTINAYQALPLRGNMIPLSPSYELTLRNDSAFATLPFFGRATYISLDYESGGIRFAEPMRNYQIQSNKKGDKYDVRFEIRTPEYQYKVAMTIMNSGECSMSFNSPQRDQISFIGNIVSDK